MSTYKVWAYLSFCEAYECFSHFDAFVYSEFFWEAPLLDEGISW